MKNIIDFETQKHKILINRLVKTYPYFERKTIENIVNQSKEKLKLDIHRNYDEIDEIVFMCVEQQKAGLIKL